MKPHIAINPSSHKWAVWHDKSLYPWQLPAVHGDSPLNAYKRYSMYKGLNQTTPHRVEGSVPVVLCEGAFWVLEDQ